MAVDNVELVPERGSKRLADGRLARAGFTHQQHGLLEAHAPRHQAQQPLCTLGVNEALERAAERKGFARRRHRAPSQHCRDIHLPASRVQRRHVQGDLDDFLQHLLHRVFLLRAAQALSEQHEALLRHQVVAVRGRSGKAVSPLEEIARRDKGVPARKDVGALPPPVQLLHDRDNLLGARRRDLAALLDHFLELLVRDVIDVHLEEAVAKGPRHHLAAAIRAAGGVLGGKEHEVRVRLDRLLRLGDQQLAVVVKEAIEHFEHLRGGQVELIQHQPVPCAQGLH